MHKYIHNVTKVMCVLYVRWALSVLQKECRNVWGARYALGARYRSENMVYVMKTVLLKVLGILLFSVLLLSTTCPVVKGLPHTYTFLLYVPNQTSIDVYWK